MTGLAPARVISVELEFLVVEAAGARHCVPTTLCDDVRPGDWVLLGGGAAVRRAAPPDAALDHPFEADLVAGRHHYPTEDPEIAGPRVHPPR